MSAPEPVPVRVRVTREQAEAVLRIAMFEWEIGSGKWSGAWNDTAGVTIEEMIAARPVDGAPAIEITDGPSS